MKVQTYFENWPTSSNRSFAETSASKVSAIWATYATNGVTPENRDRFNNKNVFYFNLKRTKFLRWWRGTWWILRISECRVQGVAGDAQVCHQTSLQVGRDRDVLHFKSDLFRNLNDLINAPNRLFLIVLLICWNSKWFNEYYKLILLLFQSRIMNYENFNLFWVNGIQHIKFQNLK